MSKDRAEGCCLLDNDYDIVHTGVLGQVAPQNMFISAAVPPRLKHVLRRSEHPALQAAAFC